MRIKILFRCQKLPIIYRHRFMSLIKEALGKSDKHYKESLYPDRKSKQLKVTKPFCFSISFPSFTTAKKEKFFVDEGVEIEDTVFYFPEKSFLSFYVSSSDYQFMVNLYNGLLEKKKFNFNDNVLLELDRVIMLNEMKISEDEAEFRTNAPILIEDKESKPVLPSVNNLVLFNSHFNAIHNRILKDIRGEELYQKIEVTPIEIKKQVVKHTLKGFREKTGKPYMTLTCFEGCFKLKGDPHDLQMLYQIGIGLRTGQGFGMVEVV